MKDTLDQGRTGPHPDYHRRFHFANGYGANVVRNAFSYGAGDGLFEIAVLRRGEICYETPVTQDVLGYVPEQDIPGVLADIESLVDEALVCVETPSLRGFEVGGRYAAVVRPGGRAVVVSGDGALEVIYEEKLRACFRTAAELRLERISAALG